MKRLLISGVCLSFIFALSAHAQTTGTVEVTTDVEVVSEDTVEVGETSIIEAGLTPASPFHFAERFFENVGTFFTFNPEKKIERYIELAEERLAEAQVLAEQGDERAQKAIEHFENQIEKAQTRSEKITDKKEDIQARIAEARTRHQEKLEGVLERVPEQAKEAIMNVKERSSQRQLNNLRSIAEQNPEKAAEIFNQAEDMRLRMIEKKVAREGRDIENLELADVEQYSKLRSEISEKAKALRSGDTTVEELLQNAHEKRIDVLKRVQGQVPEQAKEQIQQVIDRKIETGIRPNLDNRPKPPATANRPGIQIRTPEGETQGRAKINLRTNGTPDRFQLRTNSAVEINNPDTPVSSEDMNEGLE